MQAPNAAANSAATTQAHRWQDCFDSERDVTIAGSTDTFHVYECFAKNYESPEAMPDHPPPLFVLHHGGGHGALSWALTARALAQLSNHGCAVMAYDARAHGTYACHLFICFNMQSYLRVN